MLKGLFLGTVCDFSLPAGTVAQRGQYAAATTLPLLFKLPGVQQQAGDRGGWDVAIRAGPTAMLVTFDYL